MIGQTVRFVAPVHGHASAEVFDSSGRRVRTLARGEWADGPQSLVWDGRTDLETEVGPGVYFIRVATEGGTGQIKLSVVR